MKGVKDCFFGFTYEINSEGAQDDILNNVARMLRLKLNDNAPRRAPRILMLGAPGSGRSIQSKILAKKFGLVHISTTELLKAEVARKTDYGVKISKLINTGDLIPDDIVISLVE
jgi:adenylate kinase